MEYGVNYAADFWCLKPETVSRKDYPNKFTFKLAHSTDLRCLNVTTIKERRCFIFPIYTVMITNNEPSTERDFRVFHKDAPGHVTTARRFYSFGRAVGTHLAALHKLNQIGY